MDKDVNNIQSEEKKEEIPQEAVKIVKTDEGAKTGQVKCPKCGATDISLNPRTGKLRCNFCRFEFEPEKVEGFEEDLSKLEGQVLGSGLQNIVADSSNMITLKCSSCGAEVVIDTAHSTSARCHWCRSRLSINEQVPNGAIPDVVLPFKLKKEEAQANIQKFVRKRKFFAHPKFVKEFETNNIMGVYLPYMLIDVNSHASFDGEGEHLVRMYTVGSGDDSETYYDADLYQVGRDFDLTINGLSIESSKDKLNSGNKEKTTNVINAIMPFDTENCVKWNANYLRGYSSEKRDVNVDQMKNKVNLQVKDIARYSCNDTIKYYDRGVKWNTENLQVKGEQWKAAYLPVWLYSYLQVNKKDKKLLHYVAVNARTGETMGSVPINMTKLLIVSALVEFIGILLTIFIEEKYRWIFLLLGIVFFIIMFLFYRNSNARHTYERETKTNMTNLYKTDNFIKHRRRLSNSTMDGANNKKVEGSSNGGIMDVISGINIKPNVVNNLTDNVIAKKIQNQIEKKAEQNIERNGGKNGMS